MFTPCFVGYPLSQIFFLFIHSTFHISLSHSSHPTQSSYHPFIFFSLMAHNLQGADDDDQKLVLQQQKTSMRTVWRWQRRRGFPLRRRRMVQTQRLGGKKTPRRRMVALVNVLRKMKQKLKYDVCMVKKKLKECYRNLVKDMAEAGGSVESFQQRLFMETTFAVPIGITFSGTLYHHHRQPNYKTLFM